MLDVSIVEVFSPSTVDVSCLSGVVVSSYCFVVTSVDVVLVSDVLLGNVVTSMVKVIILSGVVIFSGPFVVTCGGAYDWVWVTGKLGSEVDTSIVDVSSLSGVVLSCRFVVTSVDSVRVIGVLGSVVTSVDIVRVTGVLGSVVTFRVKVIGLSGVVIFSGPFVVTSGEANNGVWVASELGIGVFIGIHPVCVFL